MPTSSSSSRSAASTAVSPGSSRPPGKCPLRGMRREPRSPAAQQERGAARDVDHPAVEAGLQQSAPVDPVVDMRRIDPVLTDLGVDEHHRDGRVPLRRVGHDAAVVAARLARIRSRSASS